MTWVLGQNLGWNKDSLMRWANREGLAGRDIRGSRSAASRAADIGTAVHTMIEAHAQGWDAVAAAGSQLTDLSETDQARVHESFDTYQHWLRNSRLTIIATELYGVDEEYQTGFCLDGLALEETEAASPRLTLIDWKTSKGTYPDHLIQVSAYTMFTERAIKRDLGLDIRLSGAHVLRVSKDTGIFHHAFWPRSVLDDGWKVFTWARGLHQMRPLIESYVR